VQQAATAAALYVKDRASVQPISSRLSPRSRDFDLRRTAIRSTVLPFNGPTHNLCNYMGYYSLTNPKGMEGWVGLVGWPIAETFPTKWWSHVNHRSGVVKG